MSCYTKLARFVFLFAAGVELELHATPIVSPVPFPGPYDVVARARNGRTGWEAALFTPDNPPAYMNPSGAPVWVYGAPYPFRFEYYYSTGTTIWSIDFNRDGDFLDSQESASRVSPSLIGFGFRYFNIFAQGNNVSSATVRNLTINGVGFGSYSSGSGVLEQSFTDTNGLFGDLVVLGELIFSADGNSDERPRVWLRLGDPEPYREYAPVPEPGSLALTAIGAAVFTMRKLRRRCCPKR
jgi:hypothetical protein